MNGVNFVYEPVRLFIENDFVASQNDEVLEVRSPATGKVVGEAALGSAADIDRALAAARTAFDTGPWPRMSYEERQGVIRRAGELLASRTDELSELVTSQNGTVIRSRQGDCTSLFDYYATLSEFAEDHRHLLAMDALVVREPMGVVGAIVPWNVPMRLSLGKILPALLAGCTVILKPAPETPLHDARIAEALAAAGLPSGVLSVIPADREVSELLVSHPDIDMISFTGSTAAGRRIGAICGEKVRPVLLELGGKSAAIVLDDVDLSTQGSLILNDGVLNNNGEACVAWSRILVPRHRHDEIVESLVETMRNTSVGDPLDPLTDVGPLVSERQRDRVEGFIRSGVDEGAVIAFGGGRPKGLESGWYVEPTLFVEATNSMQMCREEIFGPVATVIPYDDEKEAIRIANDSNYGLAGAVITPDIDRGVAIARQIRTGTVGINTMGMDRGAPFGGYKDSGVGRAHGPEGFAQYLQIKTIGLPIDKGARAANGADIR